MQREFADELSPFLFTMPVQRRERRLALAVVLASIAVFLAAAPFAKLPLLNVPAFIPIYESALVINDLVTAVLLFGQYNILRSKALFVLASAYLFTAFMTVSHALTFPGLFAPTGLLGAGPQSTAWIYMFWHGGFPLFVIAYTLLKSREQASGPSHGRAPITIVSGAVAALIAAGGFALLATAGQDALPAIMQGNHYTPIMITVVSSVWALSALALIALWRQRAHSVLDLWLMVVMCAWLFDIALSAVLNAGRFDLGFYAGRIYGLLAASFVLMVLLLENGILYARLVAAHKNERSKAAELTAVNKALEAFSYSVSHDLRAPLRAIDGYARILERDYQAPLGTEGRRLLGVVRESSVRMGQLIDDLLAFAKLGCQPLRTRHVPLNELMNQIIDELRPDYDGRRIDFSVGELGIAEADPALLKQVLTNLLSNAIKFSRNKDVAVIEVGCNKTAEDHDGNLYYVRDNGAGFDMRYTDKLFGVFQRLHNADEYEGTGVGLAIVQRIINRHGGRIWAEAKQGEGAIFYFTLPQTRPAEKPASNQVLATESLSQ